ncbi:MAG: transposon-encoded TnpW family protein [Eubacteriales bacterium]|jgi:hypothetical protein
MSEEKKNTVAIPEGISEQERVSETDTDFFIKKIGRTTYKVKVHFSETSKETMEDKIKRMLRKEASQM